jgi:DNA-directed RNA polymerase subunit RPC12/RpoP
MKVMLKKIQICKTERLLLNCPDCKERILLDLERFSDNPTEIVCYKCNHKYLVLTVDTKKRGTVFLDITKS